MRSYVEAIKRDGFASVPNLCNSETTSCLIEKLEGVHPEEAVSQRAGQAFGIRNLLNIVPFAGAIAYSTALWSLVEPILGKNARVVRGIFFDKTPTANWKVPWHQDLTVAVRRQVDIDGYGPWSIKAGIPHVQPPISVLESILTLRLHLDDTNETNGALNVIPGSHKHGRIAPQDIPAWRGKALPVACRVSRGGVLAMRPLILHSSSAALNPLHRRVLHLEYSSIKLPADLEWYGS